MTPTTRRRRVGLLATGALLASTVGLAAVSAPVGALRPDPSGPPQTVTDLVPTACNNTFQPAKFPLTWQVSSTVTSPTDGGGNAATIAPGDPFDVSFDVTVNLAASFKVSAFAIIGPQPVTISEARATIAPLSGATGPVISVGTGVTGGFSQVSVPAPGRALTGVTSVDGSPTLTAPAGSFLASDVGSLVYDSTNFANLGAIIAVSGDGSSATLANNVVGGGVIDIRIWNPADITDTPIPVGTVSGTYTANAGANTKATFQLLGSSTYAGNGTTIPADTPVGFSVSAADPRGGTVIANTTTGFGTTVSNSAKNTYARAQLAPGVAPYLVCMGGTWSANAPEPPNTTQSYGYPFNSPGGQTAGTIGNAGKSTGRLGIPVATNNASATLTGAPGSFNATDVGSPVTGSLGLPDSQPVNTGIPAGATIQSVGAGGSTAVMSAPATLTGGTAVDVVGGFAAVDITPPPIPTATISSISGQAVTNAARDTNVITFGGPNWTPNLTTGITAELCDSTGTTCDPAGLSSVTASTDVDGVLSGTATVTSTATEGTGRTLKITETSSGKTDFSATLTILGAPTLACVPSCSGPQGGSVNVTGANWNPGQVTVIAALDASSPIPQPLNTPVPVVIDSTGGLTGTLSNIPAGTAFVGVQNTELPAPPAPGSLFAILPFSLNQNALDCGQSSPLTGCALQQNLTLNIQAGNFTWSQQTPFIVLNSTTTGGGCTEANKDTCFGLVLNGKNQVATGALNQVTIIDARGQNAPWRVTAVMDDLVTGAGGTNKVIPAGNMTLTPACAVVDGGPPLGAAAVQTGAAATLSPTVPVLVCEALANQGGGTFTLNGGLSLQVPASQAAGKYTSTLTLTAV